MPVLPVQPRILALQICHDNRQICAAPLQKCRSAAACKTETRAHMDWDNLRYFLGLARSGTLMSAARRLEVDHTTVARRIQALEKEVGTPLFSREADGHRLTEAGRR